MKEGIQVSICASAMRVQWWERFYNSCIGNKLNWEIIFVGSIPPPKKLPSNFKWIYSNTKPAQCYEIAFREAKGELIHWSADDASYGKEECNLDKAYKFYKESKNYKTIISMQAIEDGENYTKRHRFFVDNTNTPRMAPMGMISNKFMKELGGYDRNFIAGQSENDLVMRGLEAGGVVKVIPNCFVYLHHNQVHSKTTPNEFRKAYTEDRKVLEKAWVTNTGTLSKKRLTKFTPFSNNEILTINQGQSGIW